MRYTFIRPFVIFIALIASIASSYAQDLQRGFGNYQDILAGRKKLEQLTIVEQQEVVRVHKLMTSRAGDSGQSQECGNARRSAENAASDSEGYARRYLQCIEGRDFSDDCDSEFRRIKGAQDDYESAVSNVQRACR